MCDNSGGVSKNFSLFFYFIFKKIWIFWEFWKYLTENSNWREHCKNWKFDIINWKLLNFEGSFKKSESTSRFSKVSPTVIILIYSLPLSTVEESDLI